MSYLYFFELITHSWKNLYIEIKQKISNSVPFLKLI